MDTRTKKNLGLHAPAVGAGVMILRDGKVLLGKRKGSWGAGLFAFPGGSLEHGESFLDICEREVLEETGLEISNLRFLTVLNHTVDGRHYIDVDFVAESLAGDPQTMEPNKCEGWEWYELDDLPSPMYGVTELCINQYREGSAIGDLSIVHVTS